jgi:hypothetical protein
MALFTSLRQKKNVKLNFQGDMLLVETDGGREQAYPLTWLPQLKNASIEEQADWAVTATGIHWNALNIDLPLT